MIGIHSEGSPSGAAGTPTTTFTPTSTPTLTPTPTSIFTSTPTLTPPPSPNVVPSLLPPQIQVVPDQYVIVRKNEAISTQASSVLTDTLLAPQIEILDLSGMIEEDIRDTLAEQERDPTIEMIEPNYVYTATFIPNDPNQSRQWAWQVINGYSAWDVTLGDATTIIGIIDTGIDLEHPDLINKVVPGYDFIGHDSIPRDDNGHGTHVAGTAAGGTDNGIGGAGACPNCMIMPLKALGSDGRGTLDDIAEAIYHAVDHGVKVINLSLGSPIESGILNSAVNYAWEKGVFVVCAAGNEGVPDEQFPAGYDNCMAVAATDESDRRAWFSNYGSWVHVAAPGDSIFSTFLDEQYATFSGTSMAAPHVAGLAGLLASQGLTNTAVLDRICDSADDIGDIGSFWSCGRVNMLRAVDPNATIPTATPTINGTQTATPGSTDSPGFTPTPTITGTLGATLTPTGQPTPTATETPTYTDEIIDGGFEEGTGWNYSADDIRTTEQFLTGQYSVRLGGEIVSSDEIEQVVLVPVDGLLGYSVLQSAPIDDRDNGNALVVQIEVLDRSNITLKLTHSGWGWSRGWHRFYIDLSPYANRAVSIKFQAKPTLQTPFTFYVDDVAWQNR